jgi:hypothetical protein
MNLTVTTPPVLYLTLGSAPDVDPIQLNLTPSEGPSLTLSMTGIGLQGEQGVPGDTTAADAAATVAAAAAAAIAGALPGLATNEKLSLLQDALAALIAAIPECDLSALATAVQLEAARADLASRLAALPTPDVGASLSTYDAAKGAQLEAVRASLAALIAGIPDADVAGALAEYGVADVNTLEAVRLSLAALIGAIPTTDVAAALATYDTAKASQVESARADLAARLAALPTPNLGAALAAYDTAKGSQLEAVHIDLAGRIAAIPATDLSAVSKTAEVNAARDDIKATSAASHTATQGVVTVAKQSVLDALAAARQAILDAVAAVATTLGLKSSQASVDAVKLELDSVQADTTTLKTGQATALADAHTTRDALATGQTGMAATLATLATAVGLTAARDYIYAYITTRTQAILEAQATAPALAAVSTKIDNIPVSTAGNRSGQVDTFRADKVPADYTKVGATDYIPSGGVLFASIAAGGGGYGSSVYVSSGANAGLWRLSSNQLQRYDLGTNKTLGSAFTVPLMGTTFTPAGLAVIGSKIYIAGVLNSSNAASALHLVFDTATGATTQLASFPSTLSGGARSVVLADGRARGPPLRPAPRAAINRFRQSCATGRIGPRSAGGGGLTASGWLGRWSVGHLL